MTKKEVPKHIKEFYDKDRKIKRLLDTTHAVHSAAYHKGLDTLKDEKGEIDYERLDDTKVQDQFLAKMTDHYLSAAVQRLGLKGKPTDELEQDILLQNYMGVTKNELKRTVRRAKSKYTLKQHEEARDQLIEEQGKRLRPLAHGHFEQEHIDDILKHIGVDKYVKKDGLSLEGAATLLRNYREQGAIHLPTIEDELLTKEGKEHKKGLKSRYHQAA